MVVKDDPIVETRNRTGGRRGGDETSRLTNQVLESPLSPKELEN